MKSSIITGHNRTGMGTSPKSAAALITATEATTPSRPGNVGGLSKVRVDYARSAEPAGTMPPPTTMKGLAKTALKTLEGQRAVVFLDKLGERLAFERAGARLYEALLSKYDAYGSWEGGPTRAELVRIRDQEREHFLILKNVLESMGADPTAVTPSANVHAVATKGMPAVLSDPRTDLAQCLEVILAAELVDNDCWENLVDLAAALGLESVAAQGETALQQEREHLENVRRWVATSLSRQATGEVADAFTARTQARSIALHSRDSQPDSTPRSQEGQNHARKPKASAARSRRGRTVTTSSSRRQARKRR
jgi:rubrerythrin